MNYFEIKNQIKNLLSEKRYEHTLGVEYTAAALAMRYGIDFRKARLAGLLHDCAKYLSHKELLEKSQECGIEISDVARLNPELLHAPLGAYMAQKIYGIDDEDILSAIKWHTTGHPKMTTLEKIVFLADYLEPNRNHTSNLDDIRELAFDDLEKCCLKVLEDTVDYLKTCGHITDPMTEKTLSYYKSYITNVTF